MVEQKETIKKIINIHGLDLDQEEQFTFYVNQRGFEKETDYVKLLELFHEWSFNTYRKTSFTESNKKFPHRSRHVFLHRCFDELCADFIKHTKKLPSKTTVLELMEWSCEQMKNPTEEND